MPTTDTVAVTATLAAGAVFDGFSGSLTSTASPSRRPRVLAL